MKQITLAEAVALAEECGVDVNRGVPEEDVLALCVAAIQWNHNQCAPRASVEFTSYFAESVSGSTLVYLADEVDAAVIFSS